MPYCVSQKTNRAAKKSLSKIAALALLTSASALAPISQASSQDAVDGPIIVRGSVAMTGFSGSEIPNFDDGLLPGVNPIDETFIKMQGISLRIFDVRSLGGPGRGQLVNTPPPFEVRADQVGQVFGLAYDDGNRDDTTEIVPNLYTTATSLHGVQIVEDDSDDDGRPERLRRGKAGARFMEGQVGPEADAGAIWKIDGLTGEVSLFATIEGNSGAGLGNIAFDQRNRQLIVSDVDTGLVHRVTLNGDVLGSFDHGADGRAAAGLEPVPDDGAVMDIAGGTFDTENTDTWGYTAPERRVWGLAVHRDRLYYAVADQQQIWSVGIGRDGEFLGDARWELNVEAEDDHEITDIAFDRRGYMYLAQRGEIRNRYDYSRFADSGKGEVMRYWLEQPDDPETESRWVPVPQTYAVGFPAGHQQTVGGLTLHYDYDRNGDIKIGRCDETLFKTGDALRDNPDLEEDLVAGGPLVVHGAQLTRTGYVRPKNEPPFGSWFFDFDGLHDDPEVRGHIGDVESWQPCLGSRASGYGTPGYGTPWGPPEHEWPGGDPCLKVEDVYYECTGAGTVWADLYVRDTSGFGGDSVQARSLTPGVSIAPPNQSRPSPAHPFSFEISGSWPGEKVRVNMCYYKGADAEKGGYFPCCKVNVTLKMPPFACR